jgi:DNA-binding NtrC family response regulator
MENNTVLVVEDDDLMQNMISDALTKNQYKITTAGDGLEGWEKFQKGYYPLVLTDLKLPKINGIELLKKIKEISPETIVILMTAYGTVQTAVEALKLGAYDYITKPFLAEELVATVKKGLELYQLQEENLLLKERLEERYSLHTIIGKSKAMQHIYQLIENVAPSKATILVVGESGTGKELVVEAIHTLSPRKDKPLIKVSCGALPETLLESELFGHEKGAFTDAVKAKKGRFELAHEGSLFLDDIDDLKPSSQVKLLRVLQEKEFERLGGTETIKVDVRLMAATKKNLQEEINQGNFREDLYYRLNVVPVTLPPLRERQEDIPLLAQHFLEKFNQELSKKVELTPKALQAMVSYSWPGNIRELENLMENLVTVTTKAKIQPGDLPPHFAEKKKWKVTNLKKNLQESEREYILKVLEMTGFKRKQAASILGISTKTLWQKMKEYDIN